MIIFLIGFMGSGKTSTGRKLASRMNYSFIDLDDLIIKDSGMSISQLFKLYGEKTFRKVEKQALLKVIEEDNVVVATGGGAPCYKDNMDIINRYGTSVYLKVKPGFLAERLQKRKEKRPLIINLSNKELKDYVKTKLKERETYYKLAHHIVDGRERNVEEIFSLLKGESYFPESSGNSSNSL